MALTEITVKASTEAAVSPTTAEPAAAAIVTNPSGVTTATSLSTDTSPQTSLDLSHSAGTAALLLAGAVGSHEQVSHRRHSTLDDREA